MYRNILVTAIVFAVCARKALLAPFRNEGLVLSNEDGSINALGGAQKPLSALPQDSKAHPDGIPIKTFYDGIYTVNISIDATSSETHVATGSNNSFSYAGLIYEGPLSRDTIHFGNTIKSTAHGFTEWIAATDYSGRASFIGNDGSLGLTPPWSFRTTNVPNALSQLEYQGHLPLSLFSLALPRNITAQGELLFGATNPKFYAEPPTRVTIAMGALDTGEWTVPARNITFASSPHPLHFSLPVSSVAVLDTGRANIRLPRALMHDINAAIGAEASPVRSSSIPCHLRAELPLLEFELGEEGEKFSVSAFDYTMEVDYAKMGYPSIGTRCASLILPVEDIGLPSDGEMIMLGSAFLKGRYSVWDWGRMEVGFAPLKE